jgi:hypothetical protein
MAKSVNSVIDIQSGVLNFRVLGSGGLVGRHQQFGVMDPEPAQGGGVSGDGSGGELSRGDGALASAKA